MNREKCREGALFSPVSLIGRGRLTGVANLALLKLYIYRSLKMREGGTRELQDKVKARERTKVGLRFVIFSARGIHFLELHLRPSGFCFFTYVLVHTHVSPLYKTNTKTGGTSGHC